MTQQSCSSGACGSSSIAQNRKFLSRTREKCCVMLWAVFWMRSEQVSGCGARWVSLSGARWLVKREAWRSSCWSFFTHWRPSHLIRISCVSLKKLTPWWKREAFLKKRKNETFRHGDPGPCLHRLGRGHPRSRRFSLGVFSSKKKFRKNFQKFLGILKELRKHPEASQHSQWWYRRWCVS